MSVTQTMILYDDRFVKYNNLFTKTKVVHKPLLHDYLEHLIEEFVLSDDDVLHVLVHDSKDDEGSSYLSEVKDLLNSPNIVVHVINPRSYYKLPDCPKIHYYIELTKGTKSKVSKLSKLVENDPNKDNVVLTLCQSPDAITIKYGDGENNKKGG